MHLHSIRVADEAMPGELRAESTSLRGGARSSQSLQLALGRANLPDSVRLEEGAFPPGDRWRAGVNFNVRVEPLQLDVSICVTCGEPLTTCDLFQVVGELDGEGKDGCPSQHETPRLISAGVVTAGRVHRQHERKVSPDSLAVVRPRGVPERLAVYQRRPNPDFVLGL